MQRIENTLRNNYIALIFSILGCDLIFSCLYGDFSIVNFLVIIFLVVIYFTFYDKVVEEGNKGPIVYILGAVIILLFSLFFISLYMKSPNSELTYGISDMIFGGQLKTNTNLSYTFGIMVLVTFVYSSMIYYFSVKVTRTAILLLLYFIPIILYIKGSYKVDAVTIYSFMISLFLLLLIEVKNSNVLEGLKVKINDKHLLCSGGIVLLITLGVCIIIPKPNKLPEISSLETIKDYVLNHTRNVSNSFNVIWGNNRKTNVSVSDGQDIVLFSFTGDNPSYLIVKNYDAFENDTWILKNDDYLTGDNISTLKKSIPILNTLGYINKSPISGKFYEEVRESPKDDLKTTMYLYSESKSNEAPHPSKVTNSKLLSGRSMYLNNFDMLFLGDYKEFDSNSGCEIEYLRDNPNPNTKEALLLTYLNYDRYLELVNSIKDNDLYTREKSEIDEVNKIYTELPSAVTKRMKKLSLELTKDEESIYLKAKEIEDYFKSGEFSYNLTIPKAEKKNYIDYFIFEGKQGYCVQYATAMTLLCRASGISARYVEGYYVDESDKSLSKYNVNGNKGHAFVEVYIPGYGWKIFDPTPGRVNNVEVTYSEINPQTKAVKTNMSNGTSSLYIGIVLVLAGGLTVVIFKVTKRCRKLAKIKRLSNEEGFELIINDTVDILSKNNITPKNGETLLRFSKRVDEEFNFGFEDIVKIYYLNKYALEKISNNHVEEGFKVNKNIYQYIKNKK